jgi:hypothetical protein
MTEPLRESYGAFYDRGQKLRRDAGADFGRLRPEKIPPQLWPLIPYAEFWGIPDDGFREKLVEEAPPPFLKQFREAVSGHESALLDWLAGPDADRIPSSDEYVAFSAMLMASDDPRHID